MEQTLHSLIAMIAAKPQSHRRPTSQEKEVFVRPILTSTKKVLDYKRQRLKSNQHMLVLGGSQTGRISRFKQKPV